MRYAGLLVLLAAAVAGVVVAARVAQAKKLLDVLDLGFDE
jgi:hypothetical protein